MVLPVVKFGDPVLRKRGDRIATVTPEIRQLIADMFETMEAANGVGLAAQQVGHALQLTVIDVRDAKERPSTLWIDNQPADPESFMPLVLINPVIKPVGNPLKEPEGCLSFPEVYADIQRPGEVEVTAQNLRGESFSFRAGGLLGRAVQHEVDHLNGILFIDRMDSASRKDWQAEIDMIQTATKARLARR
jgi:peptide deformylase